MNILVTGGSGFLGRHIIKTLTKDGHLIFALARSAERADFLRTLGARPINGDITNVTGFSGSLREMDVLVHCAAPVEFWGPWEKFQREIIDATISLAKASSQQGVKRFIHISSEAVLQDGRALVDVDESYPYPVEPNSFYGKAKKITELKLLELPGPLEIVILRPTFIWGIGCPAFSTLSSKVQSGQFMWIDQGRSQFEAVHVENAAEAVRLSLMHGKDRQIYWVTDNEGATVRQFLAELFSSLGLPQPKRSLPGWLMRPIANVVEVMWKILKLKVVPPLTKFDLAFVAMSRKYSTARIARDLHYKPIVSRESGFQEIRESGQIILQYKSIGKIEAIVTYLEMNTKPNNCNRPIDVDGTNILRLHQPSVAFYRFLYDQVGSVWNWTERKLMSDLQLSKIIQDPNVEIFVLYHFGEPAGYIEFESQKMGLEFQISFFGLMPRFVGKGLGRHMLEWALWYIWNEKGAQRLWLHTCSLDGPNALPAYLKAGFIKFDEKTEQVAKIVPIFV